MLRRGFALAWLSVLVGSAAGQGFEDPVQIQVAKLPERLVAGESILAEVTVTMDAPYHIYGLAPVGEETPTTFSVNSASNVVRLGTGVVASKTPERHTDAYVSYDFWEGSVTFRVPLEIRADAPAGAHTFDLRIKYQACTPEACLPPRSEDKKLTVLIEAATVGSIRRQAGPVRVGKVEAPPRVVAGQPFELRFATEIEAPFHIYGLVSRDGLPTTFRIEGDGVSLRGEPSAASAPKIHRDDLLEYTYFEGSIHFLVRVAFDATTEPGVRRFVIWMDHMACTMENCLAPDAVGEEVSVIVEAASQAVVDPPTHAAESGSATPAATTATPPGETTSISQPEARMEPSSLGLGDRGVVRLRFRSGKSLDLGTIDRSEFSVSSAVLVVDGDGTLAREDDGGYVLAIPVRVPRVAEKRNEQTFNVVAKLGGLPVIATGNVFIEVTLLGFIAVAAILAAAALLTPCVYPMIPITVSFFTKQAESSKRRPVTMALVYCVGIVVSFTLIGALVTLATGTGQAASNFAQSWWMQAAIAVLFIVFALSLFGMFELQLPESLMSLVGRAQGQGGVGGVLALGFLFSVTTFTCTAAFVGTILAEAASTGNWLYPLVGMTTFATVLALPFFWLSVFPSKMKALPKSGGWLNQVKVCMGFIELAAAFKFLGGMDMALGWNVFTRPLVIAVWIAAFAAMGLYLLGLFRLPHDTPTGKIGVGSLMTGLASFTFAIYLLSGLSGDPLAEGVDAYLPRELEHRTPEGRRQAFAAALGRVGGTAGGGSAAPKGRTGLHGRFEDAYEDARAEAKRLSAALFINFTGHG